MKRSVIGLLSLLLVLMIPVQIIAQDPTASNPQDPTAGNPQDTIQSNAQDTLQDKTQSKVRPYLNLGYITNLQQGEGTIKRDQGFSVRVGLLTRGRFGFYAGYIFFKEFHTEDVEYGDKGRGPVVGLDFMLVKRENFRWYVNLGLFNEKFISTYPGHTESETSLKPDFGVLFNFNHINASLGLQPSEPHHFGLGVGATF